MDEDEIIEDYLFVIKLMKDINKHEKNLSSWDNTSIHHFLGQILAFGCLYFSENNRSSTKKEKKNDIFLKFFEYQSKSNKYFFRLSKLQNLLANQLKLSINQLPSIFHMNIETKHNSSWKFNKNELDKIYSFLWKDREFFLNEDPFPNIKEIKEINEINEIKPNKKFIHPGVIGELFEKTLHPYQKKRAQKGVFYSPNSEIKFTIFTSISEIIKSRNYNISSSEKKKIIEILIMIFKSKSSLLDDNIEILKKYNSTLEKLHILDPACGSGSFLVESLNFFIVLLKQIEMENIHSFFPLIYGMDINKWAVKITQFRLWCKIFSNFNQNKELCWKLYSSKIRILEGDFILDNDLLTPDNRLFDVILGNPPYIRHRDISDPKKNSTTTNIIYRRKIHDSLNEIYNISETNKSRLDYYIYFFYHALKKLQPGGILAFIVSNSWMNVKFGYKFQEYLCKFVNILQIYENIYRSFSAAEINTVITFLQKPYDKVNLENKVSFIKWKIPYHKLLLDCQSKKKLINTLFLVEDNQFILKSEDDNSNFKISEDNFVKMFSCTQNFIYNFKKNHGGRIDNDSENYIGYNWENYFFNAPSFYFDLLKKIGKGVVFLKDIAIIKRGITTNCNNFFILTKTGKNTYTNGFGDIISIDSEFSVPFLASPKQISTPSLNPNNFQTFLFYCDKTKEELKQKHFNKTLKYIQNGEKKIITIKKGAKKGETVHGVPNLASFIVKNKKSRWYNLSSTKFKSDNSTNPELSTPKIIIQKIYNTTYKMGICKKDFIANNTFYEIKLKSNYVGQEHIIFDLLLGALSMISIELHGRTNFGGGALDTATFDIGNIILLDPLKLTAKQKEEIHRYALPLLNKPFKPSEEELKNKFRIEFDNFLLSFLPISLKRNDLYNAINKIQNMRIFRSKTFHF